MIDSSINTLCCINNCSTVFVKELQKMLNMTGKFNLSVDGVIGPKTAGALSSVDITELDFSKYDKFYSEESGLPVWVELAYKEIGTKEIKGADHNPRIIEYMQATKWGKWVHDDETPWCAGFVGWVMVNSGFGEFIPDYSLGAKSWLNFGVSTGGVPVFGALAIKNRKPSGGHVGLVVGENRQRNTLFILGGNQNDAVNIKEYPADVWVDFRVPFEYISKTPLGVVDGASRHGREI